MFAKLIRKLTTASTAEFCDSCARVCTSLCRSQAIYDKARDQHLTHLPIIR